MIEPGSNKVSILTLTVPMVSDNHASHVEFRLFRVELLSSFDCDDGFLSCGVSVTSCHTHSLSNSDSTLNTEH